MKTKKVIIMEITKIEWRAVVKFLVSDKIEVTDIHPGLVAVRGESALSKSAVSRWARLF